MTFALLGNAPFAAIYTLYPHSSGQSDASPAAKSLMIREHLNTSPSASAFLAEYGITKVIAKVACMGTEGGRMLQAESNIYGKMQSLTGRAILGCYGLFCGGGLLVLLVEYGGVAVREWSQLSHPSA